MKKWFKAAPASLQALRRWVAVAFQSHGCSPEVVDDALLVATELAANAIEHTRSDGFEIKLRFNEELARVEVTDADPDDAALTVQPISELAHGRGLRIVEALTLRWGIETTADRKTVWAELDCAPSTRRLGP